MTKEEFTKKFKVGDKIKSSCMGEGDFLKILYFGKERFFLSNKNDGEGSYSYSGDEWSLYEEPKKTVKKWLWRFKDFEGDWIISLQYHSEEEAKRLFQHSYEKVEAPGLSPWEVNDET